SASEAPEDAFLTAHCLRRYLRARGFNANKAWEMLKATILWRRTTRPEQLSAANVADVNTLGTVFLCGHDRRSMPVVYMRPGAHNPCSSQQRVSFMIWIMETSIREAERRGVEKLVWVLDFADF